MTITIGWGVLGSGLLNALVCGVVVTMSGYRFSPVWPFCVGAVIALFLPWWVAPALHAAGFALFVMLIVAVDRGAL